LFEIFLTDEAKIQLERLKKDKGLEKRYNAVKKAIRFLSENPRHKSLKTHEFTSLSGPKGEKIFEAYAEQSTPAAYRIFWYYGPSKNQITIIAITPHPKISREVSRIPVSLFLINLTSLCAVFKETSSLFGREVALGYFFNLT
jgi:hypothetical protein